MSRADEAREVLAGLADDPTDGSYSALGSLISDAVLAQDAEALRALHDGIRRLYGRRGLNTGRLLGMTDITFHALRRSIREY